MSDPSTTSTDEPATLVQETPELEEERDGSQKEVNSVTVIPESEEIDGALEEETEANEMDTEEGPLNRNTRESEEVDLDQSEVADVDEAEDMFDESDRVLTDSTNLLNVQKDPESSGKDTRMFRFPLGTVKRIVKLDEDVNMVNQDAVFLISKATELFVESLAEESFGYTSKNKKKTIQKNDVDTAIETTEALAFLDGAMDD